MRDWLLIGIAAVTALVVGCSSSEKRSESPSDSVAGADDGDGETSSGKGRSTPAPETQSSRGLDKKYQGLSLAVRGNDENGVLGEASKLLATNGNDAVALNALAMFHLKKGRVGAAKILLDKAFEKSSNNVSLLNNLALVQLADGDSIAALQTLKKAYRVDDRSPEVLGNLGSLYVQGGDPLKGLPFLEQAYKSGRAGTAAKTNYALALRATKNYEKSAKVYEELVKANTRDVGIYLNYAILLIDYMNKSKEGLPMVMKVKFLETERKDILDRANALEKKARGELK